MTEQDSVEDALIRAIQKLANVIEGGNVNATQAEGYASAALKLAEANAWLTSPQH